MIASVAIMYAHIFQGKLGPIEFDEKSIGLIRHLRHIVGLSESEHPQF